MTPGLRFALGVAGFFFKGKEDRDLIALAIATDDLLAVPQAGAFIAAVLAGAVSYFCLPIKNYPNLELPVVVVSVTRSGAAPCSWNMPARASTSHAAMPPCCANYACAPSPPYSSNSRCCLGAPCARMSASASNSRA